MVLSPKQPMPPPGKFYHIFSYGVSYPIEVIAQFFKKILNSDPSPGLLLKVILHPSFSMIFLTKYNPMPVPSTSLTSRV